ncbi:hypothetical protein [Quadrisphaera setariae]|uniref:hypothetical protein n=1 Tax=Quadrisphaera setariae TaxID=2593304 RepID=UPI00164F7229|nr:hypothetical protein [Quadrisphaera setariae]
MAKNTGAGYRVGAVRGRSQTQTSTGVWVKRDNTTGQFLAQKSSRGPFKGVRKER